MSYRVCALGKPQRPSLSFKGKVGSLHYVLQTALSIMTLNVSVFIVMLSGVKLNIVYAEHLVFIVTLRGVRLNVIYAERRVFLSYAEWR